MDTKFTGQTGLSLAPLEPQKKLGDCSVVQNPHGISEGNWRSAYVCPDLTAANFANVLWKHIKDVGDFLIGKPLVAQIQNLKHLLFGQLGVPVLAATGSLLRRLAVSCATLTGCISHVVGMGAKKKMIWANAGWDITVMTDKNIVGNRPKVQFPTNSMSQLVTAFKAKLTLSKGQFVTSPQPAFARLVDFAPKAFFGWFALAVLGVHLSPPNKKPLASIQVHVSSKHLSLAKGKMKHTSDMPGLTNICLLDRCNYTTGGGLCPI